MGQGDVRHDLSTWTRLLISQLEIYCFIGLYSRYPKDCSIQMYPQREFLNRQYPRPSDGYTCESTSVRGFPALRRVDGVEKAHKSNLITYPQLWRSRT